MFFFSKEERIGDDIGFEVTSEDMSDLSGHKNMIWSDKRKFNPVAKSYETVRNEFRGRLQSYHHWQQSTRIY